MKAKTSNIIYDKSQGEHRVTVELCSGMRGAFWSVSLLKAGVQAAVKHDIRYNGDDTAIALANAWMAEAEPLATDALPADPEGMNDDRAMWAQTALDAFAEVTNMDTAGEDAQTILTDLLADFMHWSDRNGVDFAEVLASAKAHYEEETA
jgi:hypothetical protein